MKTIETFPIQGYLSAELRKQEALLNAEYVTLFNASIDRTNGHQLESAPLTTKSNDLRAEVATQKPIEVITLPVAYDESTNDDATKAKLLNGLISPCYEDLFKAYKDKGEMSLAVVNGQVRNVVYTGSNAAGFMWKQVTLRKAYPFETKIKVITEINLPDRQKQTFRLEPGNLNLGTIAVQAKLFNFINHRFDMGPTNSVGHWITLLKSARSHSTVVTEKYESHITDSVSITVPKGIKQFNVGSIGSVTVVSSFDPLTASPWPQNFGYGMVDLRSETDPVPPLILDPGTNQYITAPGGIRLSVKLEIYKTTQ